MKKLIVIVSLLIMFSCKKDEPNNIPVIPSAYGTVTDIDGNTYKTVTLGTQTWMAENLKTTKYRNGEAINYITNPGVWYTTTIGSYCIYQNDSANKTIYGLLYNWISVTDGKNIAPLGWHVPTITEWNTLIELIGGIGKGDQLKETGTSHWQSPNLGTNSTGFNALPAGLKVGSTNVSLTYQNIGYNTFWWSSTASKNDLANSFYLTSDGLIFVSDNPKIYGMSIRCIKD